MGLRPKPLPSRRTGVSSSGGAYGRAAPLTTVVSAADSEGRSSMKTASLGTFVPQRSRANVRWASSLTLALVVATVLMACGADSWQGAGAGGSLAASVAPQ